MVVPGKYEPDSALAQLLRVQRSTVNPEMRKKLLAAGGVDLDAIWIQIVASNAHGPLPRILDIEPVSLVRNSPLDGTMFLMPRSQGVDESATLAINLDDPMPSTRDAGDGRFNQWKHVTQRVQ